MRLGTLPGRLFALRARERPAMRASREVLAELLRARRYPVHEAVLAFEAAWGGVLIGDGPDEDPHEDDNDFWLGAYACIAHGGHENPRGGEAGEALGLVPVMYSPNDVIWLLDAEGRGWVDDTIEGPGPVLCARDGDTMLASSLLASELWRAEMRPLELARAAGEEIARALSLPKVEEASDEHARWWGDGITLVLEAPADDDEEDGDEDNGAHAQRVTRVVSGDPPLLARWIVPSRP